MKFKTQESETPEVVVEVSTTEEVKKEKPSIAELHRQRINDAFELIRRAMSTIEESVMYFAENECKNND